MSALTEAKTRLKRRLRQERSPRQEPSDELLHGEIITYIDYLEHEGQRYRAHLQTIRGREAEMLTPVFNRLLAGLPKRIAEHRRAARRLQEKINRAERSRRGKREEEPE